MICNLLTQFKCRKVVSLYQPNSYRSFITFHLDASIVFYYPFLNEVELGVNGDSLQNVKSKIFNKKMLQYLLFQKQDKLGNEETLNKYIVEGSKNETKIKIRQIKAVYPILYCPTNLCYDYSIIRN